MVQKDIVLLIFKICKIQHIRSVWNLINFNYDYQLSH